MRRTIEAKQEITYEEYWLVRGIHIDQHNCKSVCAEKEFLTPPTEQDIIQFLLDTKCAFSSVEHNYRLVR